uniref:U33-Liphistoxin-Lth1a_1 n=1 Tax=Liphistius thaleban TaxID=1905330 RepID=A0A4Q8K267_9ARAC
MDGVTLSLLLAAIASILPSGIAVRCYVCSWSPDDADNRTDWCTAKNFEPRVVNMLECENGCETFAQWDKNEVLEQWRRNCIETATEMKGKCVDGDTKYWSYKRCTCNADYCNSAIYLQNTSKIILLALIFLFLTFRVRRVVI